MRRFVPALLLSFAALASPAFAATPPDAATAAATNIGPLGAQLNGTATPNGHATNVRFQYGTTTKYGKATPAQAIGQGATAVPVAAAIAGLKSNTRYHYRIVATSSAGTTRGGDKSFKTTKPTTTLTFTPNPPTFSRPFTVSGQLVGTGAGRAVTLLELFSLIAAGCGMPHVAPRHEAARAGDVRHSLADLSAAGELLGYRPIATSRD